MKTKVPKKAKKRLKILGKQKPYVEDGQKTQ